MLLLLASFMVVFPSADFSAAASNPFFLGPGRDDDSSYGYKEKYEHSKWHVHRWQALHFFVHFRRRSEGKDIARTCESEMVPRYRRASTFGSAANALGGFSYATVYLLFDNEVIRKRPA
jgi:hypothetical protein